MGEVTKHGRTILFVSHNMTAVRSLCGTSLLLDEGHTLAIGPSSEVIDRYMSRHASSQSSEVQFSRPGRASIWITRAGVLSNGTPSRTLPLGAEITLQIDFGADPATMHPRIGFVISTSDGVRLLGANNRYQPSTALASRTEHGTILCHLGRVPLTPGSYTISLWLGDQTGDRHIELDALGFSVVERDIWGLGKLPPQDGTALWWPTEFEMRPRDDQVIAKVGATPTN